MKRLTEWDEFGNADIIALSDMMPEIYAELSFSEANALTEALNRLAKYEDTGLEPDEIEFYREAQDHTESMSPKRFIEIAQAEKDGRLVVLDRPQEPLVWGDNEHNTILCPNCNHDLMGAFPEDEYCENDMYQCPYCGQSIDSTKAITREEAEAALKKREEVDNEDESI